MRRAAAILAALLLATPAYAVDLVGTWYGEGEPNDPNEVWLGDVKPDGTIKITFRACRPSILLQIVEGRWKLTGTRMEIFLERANGNPVSQHDTYEIIASTANSLRYRLTQSDHILPSNFVFQSSRVSKDFKIPGCDVVS